jgi:hypothetical protein
MSFNRTSTGRQPRVRRYARNPDSTITNPLDAFDWYAAGWADDPLWTPPSVAYTSADGLVLPGAAGNYASVPDEAALDITGDITLVARVALTDWTPAANQIVMAKWLGAGGQRSYAFQVQTTGLFRIDASTDGNLNGAVDQFQCNTAPTVANGDTLWIAATLDVDNGAGGATAKFWTSADGVTWAQLGVDNTKAGTRSTYSSTAPVAVGMYSDGTTSPVAGNVSVARVYSGSGFTAAGPSGSLVLDADFRRDRTSSFTCATGQTVTINSGAAVSSWRNGGTLGTAFTQSTGAAQPTFRGSLSVFNGRPGVDNDGTDDHLDITTGVSLAQPYSYVGIVSFDTLATAIALVGTTSAGFNNRIGATTGPVWAVRFGVASAFTGGTPAINTCYLLRVYANGASSVIEVNGTVVATGNGATDTLDQIILGAGRTTPSTFGNFHNGQAWFHGFIAGDISTSPNWPAFKRLVAQRMAITVA